ncbi:cobyrinate a,c-diamide synthase [Pontibaca methylaminivorans]|uniref:Hydrogenobyrinate a,c-diamide synthase n=1 Tax=Pontibaca methylaminivorans TaxID=515897 RepID=A0A1R3WCD6_9RHOB|nr:cobyrinate a,c-diamide synthase [Pontibaca methylaminivorans]SIT75564.1 hydrogenobyrinic acid a,c-diamide synthase (glutamine-hydrolysing) /cobyrinate a,c-diamide synthase [Pontibaca methylaminivorans]
MTRPAPGLIISAPASGAGKTTVMLGLLRCLAEDGVTVQPYKCGPDYIDPAFHRAACGRESFNLDSWAMRAGVLGTQLARGGDMALAEGSMGLFDGVLRAGESGTGASADISALTGWPVVVVLDVSGQAQTAAALAHGMATFRADVPVAGVILNRVASPRHERYLRQGMELAGLRVFGCLPRRGDLTIPERHLGLVQAVEHPDLETAISLYAAFLRDHLDLAALRQAAAGGGGAPQGSAVPPPPGQRIALAQDAAFSFTYAHLVDGWREQGAEILPFSPLADMPPPMSADVCWLPSGYPELHAGRIAAAGRFLSGLRRFADHHPVHGECGGHAVLGEALIDRSGASHRMAGLLGLVTSHERRRMSLGYRLATLDAPIPGHPAGARLRGHEFHYSTTLAQPDAPLARVVDADGTALEGTGSFRGRVSGTPFHLIAGAS